MRQHHTIQFVQVALAIASGATLGSCADCGQGIAMHCSNDDDCPTEYRCVDLVCARSPGGQDSAAPIDASSDGQVVPTDAARNDASAADVNAGDSARPDGQVPDQQPLDRLVPDAGSTDSAARDQLATDASVPDALIADAALEDAAPHGHCPGNSDPLPDSDLDGIGDSCDNCPLVSNAGQEDFDTDGLGDICDTCTDGDGDGFGNPGYTANTCIVDNCPAVDNPGQENGDGDGLGDACDGCPADPAKTAPLLCGCGVVEDTADSDTDSVINCLDNCPLTRNLSQTDTDLDGQGDVCDTCTDTDGDGYGNPGYSNNSCRDDNCPNDSNPPQQDSDWDGLGDACDPRPNEAVIGFTRVTGPVQGCNGASLVSDGTDLWYLCHGQKRIFSSPTGATDSWTEHTSASSLGSDVYPLMGDSAMGYDPIGQRLIMSRWSLSGTSEHVVYYNMSSDSWTLVRRPGNPAPTSNQAHVVVNGWLFSAWIGIGSSNNLRRFVVADITPTFFDEEYSGIPFVANEDSPQWFSNATKMAVHNGMVYLIKNDWNTPPLSPPTVPGDQLLRFDPATFAFTGITPAVRLETLPFELGGGSALVALPAGWAGLGAQGGMLVLSGVTPSDQNGWCPPATTCRADLYAIYDVAADLFRATATLPANFGGGTSAAFHKGAVVIKMGGSENYYFYIARPVPN